MQQLQTASAKSWISNISDKGDTATAIGTYTGFQSICTLIASSLAGLIWYKLGAKAVFIVSGIATVVVTGYFILSGRHLTAKSDLA